MTYYKRLTPKSWHKCKFAQLNPREVLYKLWCLENQIENGELVQLNSRKPLIWGDEEQSTILCPHCGEDLMGGFEVMCDIAPPMVQCPRCGGYVFSDRVDEYDPKVIADIKGE